MIRAKHLALQDIVKTWPKAFPYLAKALKRISKNLDKL